MHTSSGPRTPLRGSPRLSFFLALCATCLLALPGARAADPPPAPPAAPAAPPIQVKVTTSMGDFVIELLTDRAPMTSNNFLRYVKEGFYTDTLFHRVVSSFVIQGGGFTASGAGVNLKPAHEPIFNESGNGVQNKRGMVGMARGTLPHSGNSQFFVDLVDNPDLDPLPTRWGYAVFGKVVSGMDVVDRIGTVPTGPGGPPDAAGKPLFKEDFPVKPVIIQKIEIIGATASSSGASTSAASASSSAGSSSASAAARPH
jgi:cyclophilin family peptidyl-prolyl cis-trans isomerase